MFEKFQNLRDPEKREDILRYDAQYVISLSPKRKTNSSSRNSPKSTPARPPEVTAERTGLQPLDRRKSYTNTLVGRFVTNTRIESLFVWLTGSLCVVRGQCPTTRE